MKWYRTSKTGCPPLKRPNHRPRKPEMLREDVEDLSGTRPFWRDDELYFSQQTAIVAGRLLE